MSFMNQNMLPSLCNKSHKVVVEAILCQLLFMGPKITTASKEKYILVKPDQEFWSNKSGGFVGQNKIRISVTKDGFYSNRLNPNARTEPEELCIMQLADINAKSGVVTSSDLKPYLKSRAQKKSVTEMFQLEALCSLKLQLMADFQQLPMNMQQSLLKQFWEQMKQETLQIMKKRLKESLVSISPKSEKLAPIHFPLRPKTIKFDENLEKPVEKAISSTSIKSETQVSVNLPEKISAKPDQSCWVCSEPIWKKKFFDERRFGILEKCKCAICYGCLRKLTCTTDGVVKGPVECPTCKTVSDNVASSSKWIKDEDKEQFFKDYCKNVQNTGIKMRLGWTSFPKSKENVWTRAL